MPDWGRFTPWRTHDSEVNEADDRVHQWWFRFPNDLGASVMEFPQRPGVYDLLPSQWVSADEFGAHWADEQAHLPLADVITLLAAIEQLEQPGEIPYLEPDPATWY